MKYRTILLLILMFSLKLSAQDSLRSVIASAGDHWENDEIQISWTLGEVAVETWATDNLTLSQGFQQGNLFVTTMVDDQHLGFLIKAYPNPVKDILFVESQAPGFSYRIIDANGRIISHGKASSTIEELDFSHLAPGTYFIRVGKRSTHKIIKK